METTATPPLVRDDAPKRRRRTKLIALIAGIILIAIGGAATAALAVGPPEGALRYEWSIGDRYGVDADGDGTTCKMTVPVTKLGAFTAKVEIKVDPVTVDSRSETITPKDHLVVSVGWSAAS